MTTLAALLFSCSKSVETVPSVDGAVSFGGGIVTKATMQDDYSFSWAAGDELSLFAEDKDGGQQNRKKYTVDKDGATSPFSPAGDPIVWNGKAQTFYAFYPFNELETGGPDWIEAPCPARQTQKGATSSHLDNLAFMIADPVTVDPTESAVEEAIGLNFKHVMSFLEFRLKASANDNNVRVTSINITTSAPNTYFAAGETYLKMKTLPFPHIDRSDNKSTKLTLDIEGGLPVSTTEQKAWAVILPFNHSAGKFTIRVDYSDGSFKKLPEISGVNLASGKLRPIKVDVTIPTPIPTVSITVNEGQTLAEAITASGVDETTITKIVYTPATVTDADINKMKSLQADNNLTELVFENFTNDPTFFSYWKFPDHFSNIEKMSFPKLTSLSNGGSNYIFGTCTNLMEIDLGNVTSFGEPGTETVFADCPSITKITLRSKDAMTLNGKSNIANIFSITYTSDIELILNQDGAEYQGLTPGSTDWQGSIFRKIVGTTFE